MRASLLRLGLAIATTLVLIVSRFQGVSAQESDPPLLPLQIHPLPASLAQWQDSKNTGDYFSSVKTTSVGYLVWSQFPIKIYLDRPSNPQDTSAAASTLRFQKWTEAVLQAIQEWNVYLPLVEVKQPELANIVIKRQIPPLGSKINPETGKLELTRARSAQTRYQIYLNSNNPPMVSHLMTIEISPGLSNESILSATRHELGHALGIWGHSPLETDTMYFSQVRNPPPISSRDINTLKQVYQQPTRLGWAAIR